MTKRVKWGVAFMGILTLLGTLIGGCGGTSTTGGSPHKVESKLQPEGAIVRMEYLTKSGSLYGADFTIDVSEKGIAKAYYFSIDDGEYKMLEDKKLEQGQWEQLCEVVMSFATTLEPVKQMEKTSEEENNSGMDFFELDGGDEFEFALTWDVNGEQKRCSYYQPKDQRCITLFDLLREAADPIGREIVFYDTPVLNGLYFREKEDGEKANYSYQLTPYYEGDGSYQFTAYYMEGKEEKQFQKRVPYEVWEEAYAVCQKLEVEAFGITGGKKDAFANLYYSDEKQTKVILDKETAASLHVFFQELVDKYKQK